MPRSPRVATWARATIACWAMATAPAAAMDMAQQGPSGPALQSPALAAGLALCAPIGLLLLSSQSSDFIVTFGVPVMGLGLGHAYAGEPVRGGVVAIASTLAGVGAFAALNPSGGNGGGGAYLVAVFATSLAMGIAATDAYLTVQAKNEQLLSAPPALP